MESVVTVALTAQGDDCEMTLTHERLPAGQAPNHLKGWSAIADQLGTRLTRHG